MAHDASKIIRYLDKMNAEITETMASNMDSEQMCKRLEFIAQHAIGEIFIADRTKYGQEYNAEELDAIKHIRDHIKTLQEIVAKNALESKMPDYQPQSIQKEVSSAPQTLAPCL